MMGVTGQELDVVIADALTRIPDLVGTGALNGARISADDLEIESWPQAWGDTTLAFGGYGGQAITTAQTWTVTAWPDGHCLLVYVGGRFAYALDLAHPTTREYVRDRAMPARYALPAGVRWRRRDKRCLACQFWALTGPDDLIDGHHVNCPERPRADGAPTPGEAST